MCSCGRRWSSAGLRLPTTSGTPPASSTRRNGAPHDASSVLSLTRALSSRTRHQSDPDDVGAKRRRRPNRPWSRRARATFVIDLTADLAPKQLAYSSSSPRSGLRGHDVSSPHQIRDGAGRRPALEGSAKRAQYGTGGLNQVKAEARAPKLTRGSVAAVLAPAGPTALAHSSSSSSPISPRSTASTGVRARGGRSRRADEDFGGAADAGGKRGRSHRDRRITTRARPPEPFVNETVQELGGYRAILDTQHGPITIEFFVDKAPNTVRQFLKLVAAGVYDGMSFHRWRLDSSSRLARSAPARCRSPRSTGAHRKPSA